MICPVSSYIEIYGRIAPKRKYNMAVKNRSNLNSLFIQTYSCSLQTLQPLFWRILRELLNVVQQPASNQLF